MSASETPSTAEPQERDVNAPAAAVESPAEPAPEPAAPVPAAVPKPVPRRSVREWFWRSRALAEARGRLQALPSAERERLDRARTALELADRALDPIDPLPSGSSVPLSLSLYREAAYWGLMAQAAALEARELRTAFEQTPEDVLVFASGGGGEALDTIRRALVEKDFVATAADPLELQQNDARAASAFVHALIQRKLGDRRVVGRLLVERWLKMGMSILLAAGVVVAAALFYASLSLAPDLAQGKPWRASSTYPGCSIPLRTCGESKIFFHTAEDDNPWVEIDLKKQRQIARIDVRNRTDADQQRAIPLVLEVSNDAKSWKQVARRDDPFVEWTAEFKAVKARYVRARVPRRTFFHLERISVRER